MRVQRVAIAATAALLGSLALSACSGSATGSVGAGGQVSVSASASGAASGSTGTGSTGTGSTGTGSTGSSGTAGSGASGGSSSAPGTAAPIAATGGGSGSGSGGSGGGTGSGTGGGTGAAMCTTAHLGFGIGPDSGPQAVGDTTAAEVVKLTNNGSASCTMRGFPGVDLKTNAGTFSVPRAKQSPQTVTLAPGASALFSIDYTVNNTGGSGVRVDSMVITPPNETHSYTLAWNQGTLPVTDGSGSFINVTPVTPFAD